MFGDPYFLFWAISFGLNIALIFTLLQANSTTRAGAKLMKQQDEMIKGEERIIQNLVGIIALYTDTGQVRSMEETWRPTVELPIVHRQFKTMMDFMTPVGHDDNLAMFEQEHLN